MKQIPLTQGKFALVDDGDFEMLSAKRWFYTPTGYAQNSTYMGGGRKGAVVRTIQMHRFIMSPQEGMFVDHINHDTLDNRRENLRICTPTENIRNKRTHNKTGFKGVYAVQGKYQATIYKDGHNKSLGYFVTPLEAAQAYNKAAREYHGEFAYLNKALA